MGTWRSEVRKVKKLGEEFGLRPPGLSVQSPQQHEGTEAPVGSSHVLARLNLRSPCCFSASSRVEQETGWGSDQESSLFSPADPGTVL